MAARIWSPDIRDLGDRLAALRVDRAVELSEYLEQVHGLKAAATVVAVTDARDDQPPPPPPPPTEFDVILEGFDTAQRIAVLRVVRELTGLGLKEVRDLVEGVPRVVKKGLPQAEAERVKAQLEAAGARVSLKGVNT